MKTVIVSPDLVGPVKNGGIGTFVLNFTMLLRQQGHNVSIIFCGPLEVPRKQWLPTYDAMNVPVTCVTEAPPFPNSSGTSWFIRRSEAVMQAIPADADIVYLQDWQGSGFHSLKRRRFENKAYPIFVSVLHSSTTWSMSGMQQFPQDAEDDLGQDFIERYAVQHSDFVVSPSAYMLNWAEENGWVLPLQDRQRILGYPFMPTLTGDKLKSVPTPPHFRRIAFFGRLETRKGFDLFVESLLYLHGTASNSLSGIQEIVFLGREGIHTFSSTEEAMTLIQNTLHVMVTLLSTFDSHQAQHYLAENASDTLVVMPSLIDNMPYSVIEASLIPGLNIICSSYGGIPEIFGEAATRQLFVPYRLSLVRALQEWLNARTRPLAELGHYDWQHHNQQWIAFHDELSAYAQDRAGQAEKHTTLSIIQDQIPNLLDICIPYYNHGNYLPQLLEVLEAQTLQGFNVFVVNDGSSDGASVRIFDEMVQHYRHRGWQFLTNPTNEGLSKTRNIAAAAGTADYILFLDSDNVPAVHMVERFLTGILNSGDDCLTCYMQGFLGEQPPYRLNRRDGKATMTANPHRIVSVYLPLGNCPELGIFVNTFGDANFIVRRKVFEMLGGFSLTHDHYRYIGYEDYEFLARLSLANYKLDVIAEYLFFYRVLQNSLFHTSSSYLNIMRVQEVYRDQLRQAGLEHLIPLLYGLRLRARDMPSNFNYTEPQWLAKRVPWYNLRAAVMLKIGKHLPRLPRLLKALSHRES